MIVSGGGDERLLRAGKFPCLHKRELGWKCQRIDRIEARSRIDASHAEGFHAFLEAVRAEIKELPGVHGKGFVADSHNELVVTDSQRQADAGEARVIRAERVVVGDRSWRTDENRLTRSHIDAECMRAGGRRARRERGRSGDEAVRIARAISKYSGDLSRDADVLGEGARKKTLRTPGARAPRNVDLLETAGSPDVGLRGPSRIVNCGRD